MALKLRGLGGWMAAGALMLAAAAVAPLEAEAAGNELLGIDLADDAASLRVHIRTRSRPESTAYKVSEPSRVVVELRDTGVGETPRHLEVNNGAVYEVRTEEVGEGAAPTTKVVFYLDRAKDFIASTSDGGVDVELLKGGGGGGDALAGATSGQKASEQGQFDPDQLSSVQGDHAFPGYEGGFTRILGVDFKNRPGSSAVSHIVITADHSLEYNQSGSGSQLVFQIPDARLGTGLERALDTSQFASAVSRVTAYQDRRNRDEVRLVVDLREAVDVKVTRGGSNGEILTVEFPIPPSIAASQAEAPVVMAQADQPPASTPAAGPRRAESATGREKLVTGGKSLDPATALSGSGGLFGRDDGLIVEGKQDWSGRRINMDLVNADIHNVFRLISNVGKVNIVTSDEVKGTVTVRLLDVPWDQALAAILQAKGLGASQFGNILRVAPIGTIRAEKEAAVQAQKATVELLPLGVLTLPLNYAQAKDLSVQVKSVLSERASVTVDDRSNTLIVKDISEGLQRARELILALDTQTPQVLIEARIVEATDSFSRALGIQWGGNLNFTQASGSPTGLYFPNELGVSGGQTTGLVDATGQATAQGASTFTTAPNWVVDLPSAASAGSLAIALGSINNIIGLDARLTAIESTGNGRIISSPRVIAQTNESATIEQGSRIPYVTTSLRGTQTQFADATLKLEVVPQVTADRNVILDLSIKKNSVDFGRTVAGLPTIEIKEAKTTAMVKDGETTVIGGVYSVDESVAKTYVPGLGQIPILGALFKTTATNQSRKELLVFITPTILTRSLPRQMSMDAGSTVPAAAP